jgi:hypothetical protein
LCNVWNSHEQVFCVFPSFLFLYISSVPPAFVITNPYCLIFLFVDAGILLIFKGRWKCRHVDKMYLKKMKQLQTDLLWFRSLCWWLIHWLICNGFEPLQSRYTRAL